MEPDMQFAKKARTGLLKVCVALAFLPPAGGRPVGPSSAQAAGFGEHTGTSPIQADSAAARRPDFVAEGTRGMVASDSPYASQVGCEVLKAGGNAVDAAIATSLALSVTRPFSTGLGGGGFFMVRLGATGEVFCLDYRERAPAAAAPDMYVKARAASQDGPPPSRFGGLAAGVPGLLAGQKALHARFGTRPLSELIEPARRLAEKGFAADSSYVGAARGVRNTLAKYPSLQSWTAAFQHRFRINDPDLAPGSLVTQPELAAALALIAREGINAFYRGRIAEALVQAVRARGGIMTARDLADYQARWREPLRVDYRNRFEVLLMPPPSSGGVAVAEMLNILEHWDLAQVRREDPALAAHLMVEAAKHAMADRAELLGDPDFSQIPVDHLVDKKYAHKLTNRIRPDRTSEPTAYGSRFPDDDGTSHYCVADRWGNVVSATETINTDWGSLVWVESWGIVLNNEMDDFTVEPGRPNAYNLLQSEANAVGPLKRPLSSMSPSIVVEKRRPALVLGGSGGPRIITAVLQVMVKVLDCRMPLGQAVSSPRWHHQWQPNELYRNEYSGDDPVVTGLAARGHVVSARKRSAVVQAIRIEKGRFIGASDPRKGGKPAGF